LEVMACLNRLEQSNCRRPLLMLRKRQLRHLVWRMVRFLIDTAYCHQRMWRL
jgi:hypothetical protein